MSKLNFKEKNSPEVWDKIFKPRDPIIDIYDLRKAELSVSYSRIKDTLQEKFGQIKGLKVIEIGAGRGVVSALLAKEGAEVTILDYSDNALKQSEIFFTNNNLQAKYIKADALDLDTSALNSYDVSISFGLAEHFASQAREKIIESHLQLLKRGGITFISVPNKYCLPYRIFKFVAETLNVWVVGEEYPFSRSELKKLALSTGLTEEVSFIADSFFSSFGMLNPKLAYYYYFKKGPKIDLEKITKLKKEKGTKIDSYLSYALIMVGVRK